MWLEVTDFTPGEYEVTCWAYDKDTGERQAFPLQDGPIHFTIPANGVAKPSSNWSGCWTGGRSNGDVDLTLHIEGWGDAEPTNWD